MGFGHSPTNQYVYNIKMPMSCRGTTRWPHKSRSINAAIDSLREAFGERINHVTLVPIPPSKTTAHPEYDNRVTQIAQGVVARTQGNALELVHQIVDMEASHRAQASGRGRASIEELVAAYEFNRDLARSCKPIIGIFDDVLTTGRHFKAMQRVILRHFPQARVVGFFVARCVPEANVAQF
jgi:predicted amidophosphoribosyltransferase